MIHWTDLQNPDTAYKLFMNSEKYFHSNKYFHFLDHYFLLPFA